MAIASIKQLVVWTPPKELDTTGEEVDVVEHLRFLMGEIVNAYLPANGLDKGEITDEGKALYLIVADCQLAYLNVNISGLAEESYVSLIVTMILEEIDLIICHFHFAIIEVYTSFVNDDQTIFHEVSAYIIFGDLISTTNRKIAIHSTARSQSLFSQFGSVG